MVNNLKIDWGIPAHDLEQGQDIVFIGEKFQIGFLEYITPWWTPTYFGIIGRGTVNWGLGIYSQKSHFVDSGQCACNQFGFWIKGFLIENEFGYGHTIGIGFFGQIPVKKSMYMF